MEQSESSKMLRNNALLLDIDGVCITNRALSKAVYTRSSRFVARKLSQGKRISRHINHILYGSFGHTVHGMNAMFEKNVQVDEFNAYVYDEALLQAMEFIVQKPSQHIEDLQRLLWRCKQRGVDVFVFSNAPYVWCSSFMDAIGIQHELLPKDRILCADHPLLAFGQRLKPAKTLYDAVHQHVQMTTMDCEAKLVFVDDSLMNLAPVVNNDAWIPVYFNSDLPKFNSGRLRIVNDLSELQPLLFGTSM